MQIYAHDMLVDVRAFLVLGVFVLFAAGALAIGLAPHPMTMHGKPMTMPPADAPANVTASFAFLSHQKTDACAHLGDMAANMADMDAHDDTYMLQGSCCSPMDGMHYAAQIESLKAYSNISIIPSDPYNVTAGLAKELMHASTQNLTAAQQTEYSLAVSSAHEGLCCCECWAWYAHEGLAKSLIADYGMSSKQVGSIIDLEGCCGGA